MNEEINENVGKKLAFHIGDYWGRKLQPCGESIQGKDNLKKCERAI